jgi:hypothetical protein
MKYISTAFAAAAFLSLAAPAWAQMSYTTAPRPMYYGGSWPEMMDDGSSSDFPTHTPSDFVADRLNSQVLQFNAGQRPTPP